MQTAGVRCDPGVRVQGTYAEPRSSQHTTFSLGTCRPRAITSEYCQSSGLSAAANDPCMLPLIVVRPPPLSAPWHVSSSQLYMKWIMQRIPQNRLGPIVYTSLQVGGEGVGGGGGVFVAFVRRGCCATPYWQLRLDAAFKVATH